MIIIIQIEAYPLDVHTSNSQNNLNRSKAPSQVKLLTAAEIWFSLRNCALLYMYSRVLIHPSAQLNYMGHVRQNGFVLIGVIEEVMVILSDYSFQDCLWLIWLPW